MNPLRQQSSGRTPGAPNRRRRAAARTLAAVLGALALLLLSGFAAWVSLTTRDSAVRVRQANAISDALQQARYDVEALGRLERDYRLQPAPELIDRMNATSGALARSLATVRRTGSRGDRLAAATVLNDTRTSMHTIAGMVKAIHRGDAFAVARIDDHLLHPTFARMEAAINRAAAAHHREAVASLGAAQDAEGLVLLATSLMFALGLLLIGAIVVAIRLRGRLEDARVAELDRLKQAALTDNLTRLANHRAFYEDLDAMLAAWDHGSACSLVMLDLDGLKETNDRCGHQAGDALIVALADGLGAVPDARSYRVGGDEFALVVAGHSALEALASVQRLQGELASRPSDPVTVTAGIADVAGPMSKHDLIRHADLALIEAKRRHRRALVYTPSLEHAHGADTAADDRYTGALATALARAVDAKDSSTRSHCEMVSELCALIAERLGFTPEHIAKVRIAGLLHDVGKIGITDSILQKPGKLTEEEYEIMQTHSALGYHIVAAAELHEEAVWILRHHERPDGRGYPDALAATEIPLESRILMVADAFEAITADRPYRKGRSVEEALAEVERHTGTQFDPGCVAALRDVILAQSRHYRWGAAAPARLAA